MISLPVSTFLSFLPIEFWKNIHFCVLCSNSYFAKNTYFIHDFNYYICNKIVFASQVSLLQKIAIKYNDLHFLKFYFTLNLHHAYFLIYQKLQNILDIILKHVSVITIQRNITEFILHLHLDLPVHSRM